MNIGILQMALPAHHTLFQDVELFLLLPSFLSPSGPHFLFLFFNVKIHLSILLSGDVECEKRKSKSGTSA